VRPAPVSPVAVQERHRLAGRLAVRAPRRGKARASKRCTSRSSGFRWSLPLRAERPHRLRWLSSPVQDPRLPRGFAALPVVAGRKRGWPASAEVANVATPIGIRNWAACAVSAWDQMYRIDHKGQKMPHSRDCLCGLAVYRHAGYSKMFGLALANWSHCSRCCGWFLAQPNSPAGRWSGRAIRTSSGLSPARTRSRFPPKG